MDYEAARANMIEQQIRPWNVLARQTLNALAAIRREDFVPAAHRDLAFADVQIPLAGDEVMLEPKVSARMLEALRLNAADKVLQIGCGSGYLTALLALVSAHVLSVEINPALSQQAERNLGLAGITNYQIVAGDGHQGWGESAQFDAILISGSIGTIAATFMDKLKPNGRLVGIEGNAPAMQAVVYTKADQQITRKTLFETWVPRLKHADDKPEFIF